MPRSENEGPSRGRSESQSSQVSGVSSDPPSTLEIKRKRPTKVASSKPPDSKPEIVARYANMQNFFGGYTLKPVTEPLGDLKSPSTPRSPDSIIDVHSPLLDSPKSDEPLKTKKNRPTTVTEIQQLTPEEINTLFFEAIEESKHNPKAKKSSIALFALLIAAILSDINFSFWLRKHIEKNLIFIFSTGYLKDLAPEIVDAIVIFSWIFAGFNLLVDLISVNPAEEAFKLLNAVLKWLTTKCFNLKNIAHFMGDILIFIPVGAMMASAAVNGLPDLINQTVNDAAAIIIEILQILYFTMFSHKQFGEHLDTGGELFFSLISSFVTQVLALIRPNKIPSTAAETKTHPQSAMKKEEKPSLFERWEEVATFASMFRFLTSTYIFRIMSAVLPFIQILTDKFHMQDGHTKTKLSISAVVVSFVGAVLMRTRQPLLKTYNEEFKQLTLKQIRAAKVGKARRTADAGMAISSGMAIFMLVYNNVHWHKVYSIPAAVFAGLLSGFTTGSAFNRTSKRTSALEAKKLAQEHIILHNLPTINSRLLEVLSMSVSEGFDAVVEKAKTSSSWGTSFINVMARIGRGIATGNFISDSVSLNFTNQVASTVYLALPIQMNDYHAFAIELDHVAYLLAKWKITGGGCNFVSHLATPKQHFEFLPIFKALCKLDPVLNAAFQAFKQVIISSLNSDVSEDEENDLILSLQKHVKAENVKTVQRLSRWVNQISEKTLKRWKKTHPEFTPYIETLKSQASSNPEQIDNFELTGRNFLVLKDLENRLFQREMFKLVQDEWIDNQDPEDRKRIEASQLKKFGQFSISQEDLALIERFENYLARANESLPMIETSDSEENKTSSTQKATISDEQKKSPLNSGAGLFSRYRTDNEQDRPEHSVNSSGVESEADPEDPYEEQSDEEEGSDEDNDKDEKRKDKKTGKKSSICLIL